MPSPVVLSLTVPLMAPVEGVLEAVAGIGVLVGVAVLVAVGFLVGVAVLVAVGFLVGGGAALASRLLDARVEVNVVAPRAGMRLSSTAMTAIIPGAPAGRL